MREERGRRRWVRVTAERRANTGGAGEVEEGHVLLTFLHRSPRRFNTTLEDTSRERVCVRARVRVST